MKIHIGCGRHYLEGYVNVDAVHRKGWPKPDLLARMSPDDPLPFVDGTVDEILCVHLLEHVHLWEARALLAQWERLLKRGGRLVLELPNIQKCARNLLEGTDWSMSMFGLYGDPQQCDPWMAHKWGWTPYSLRVELLAVGFGRVKEEPTEWHPKGRENRDMRLVAVK